MPYIVYQTTNQITGRIYVGVHKMEKPNIFDGYLGSGKILYRAIKKYGKENIVRKTLFEFDLQEDAYTKEAEIVNDAFIARLDTYNLNIGGKGGCSISGEEHYLFGRHRSEETRRKISIAVKGHSSPMKGKHHSEETRKKISIALCGKMADEGNPMFGRHHSEKTKKKMSAAGKERPSNRRGKHLSKKTCQKMSDAAKLRIGEKNSMFGKHHSEEAKKKMSDSWQGRKYSEKYKRRISESRLSPDIIKQRRHDIESEPKIYGWKTKLAKRWDIKDIMKFVNKYALDLIKKET